MASFRRKLTARGSVTWQAIWREPAARGGLQQRVRNFSSQKDAREHAQRMEQEVERKGVGDPQKSTLEQFVKRWLAGMADRGEHSPTTLESYRWLSAIANRHIGTIPLERLTARDLDECYALLLKKGGIARKPNADGSRGTRPLTARTVLHVHRVISNALQQAKRWRLVPENVAKDARAPTPRRQKVRSFDPVEVQQLLDAAAADNRVTYLMLAVLLTCGLRRSELLGLCLDALDLDGGTLTVKRVVLEVRHEVILRDLPKSESSERTLTIPAALTELLREQKARVQMQAVRWGKGYRREPMFLFAQADGEPVKPMTTTTRLRQVMRRARVSGRPPTHGWRHTAATVLVGSGTDVKTVKNRLGHSTPAITLALYVHPTIERDQAAGDDLATLLKPATRA